MLLTDIVLSGLILGGMYALLAMGLTLQYGVARIMNLAYGEFLIMAAFGAYLLFVSASISPLLALIVALPAAFALNWLVYQILLMPLVRRAGSRGALEVEICLCHGHQGLADLGIGLAFWTERLACLLKLGFGLDHDSLR